MGGFEQISDDSYLVDHAKIVQQLYHNNFLDQKLHSAHLNGLLFCIDVPYDRKESQDDVELGKKRKRLKTVGAFDETTQKISDNHARLQEKLSINPNPHATNNKISLEFIDAFNDASNYDNERCFRGQNATESTILTEMDGESFIIPPRVTFVNSTIDRFSEYIKQDETFDLMVLDPPWWNKYIRRVKTANAKIGYRMLANEDIKKIPLEQHLHRDTFVVVWCTNAQTHIDAITKEFFPKWGVELVGVWYWIKITKAGQPVCKFNEPKQKQPYERIYIGLPAASAMANTFPRELFLYSVPSTLHSHKPPLQDFFTSKFIPKSANCLELFARSLYSGCTSYGMEVLKLQNKRLYELAMEDDEND
ncbi:N(6)-adenine-specific methyltransferase METTL4 [Anopheles nili]|uniref:N(6)-adenine-specific methyltransferase METTL4 n=1 Tax=Anopheles nili TaxID=185578 RepID=UPI00237BA927|nr:N(6)-adenine-specific methyltransferase METTL4 [Anopheles nili]